MIRTISRTISGAIVLTVRRIPIFAFYAVCLFALWNVGKFVYAQFDMQVVKAKPSAEYIKYTSLRSGNIREGQDLFYTVCRDFTGRYEVNGKRTIYVIPQGKSAKDRVLEVALPYKGTIEGKSCQSYKIAASTYHLSPGTYQLSLSGTFKVDYGIEKSYYIDGDVLTVYPQPAGTPDVKAQLFNLSPAEIKELRRILGITDPMTDSTTIVETAPAAQSQAVQTPRPVTSPSSSPSPPPTPAPTPRPCALALLQLCVLGAR